MSDGKVTVVIEATCSKFHYSATAIGSLRDGSHIEGMMIACNGLSAVVSASASSFSITATGTDRGNPAKEKIEATVTLQYQPASATGYERSVSCTLAPGEVSTISNTVLVA